MVSITTKVILFHLFVCVVKLLYFLFLLAYLLKFSSDMHKLCEDVFDEAIVKDQGIPKLSIALTLGILLECIGIIGSCTKTWKPIIVYVLMHISVVPYYFNHSNFGWKLWLAYVVSLIPLLAFIAIFVKYYAENYDKKFWKEQEELAAQRARERRARFKKPETRVTRNPSREDTCYRKCKSKRSTWKCNCSANST